MRMKQDSESSNPCERPRWLGLVYVMIAQTWLETWLDSCEVVPIQAMI